MQNYFTVPGSSRHYKKSHLLAVLLVPLMMILLQVSSVDNLLPSIQEGISASPSQVQWVLSGYALATGIMLVPSGRLGDVFGRSGVFVIGLGIFTLGSLACALASDATVLNAMRVLQGVGAGVCSPQVTGLIQQYFQGRERARAFGLMGLVISMSVAAGPTMSGAFVQALGEQSGWRFSFAVNVPLGIIGIIAAFYALPFGKERRKIGKNAKEINAEYIAEEVAAGKPAPVKRGNKLDLDPFGMLIFVLAVLGIMLPFMTEASWRWALLPAGVLCAVAWVLWERRYEQRDHIPMMNLGLFKHETFAFSVAISALQFLGTTSIFVILAMFLQQGLHISALHVGLIGMPNAIASAFAAVWSGNHALERGRQIQVLALSCILIGVGGLIGTSALVVFHSAPVWIISFPLIVQGFGFGCMGAANQTTSMLEIPASHGGTAGGFYQTVQRVMTAIGNALITAIFFAFSSGHVSSASAQQSHYFTAFSIGLAAVAVMVASALTVAIIFTLRGRKARY